MRTTDLILRSARSARLEDLTLRRREAPSRRVATGTVLVPTLRDAALRAAPQGEASP
jgi:hypothetical protein